jgi:subtilisin family serine protease
MLASLMLLAPAAFAAKPPLPPHVPGEVLVQLRSGTGNLRRDAAIRSASGHIVENVMTRAMQDAHVPGLLRVATTLPIEDAIARLQRDPDVAFAEPNWLCWNEAISNDTYYANGNLWGMYSNDSPAAVGPANTTNAYGSQAEKAWAAGQTGSRSVYVGVVDEGMAFAHPDLAANAWTNPFDPVDGVDNDHNGYVDDIHGWDFLNGDNSVYDGPDDDHGTHVAGTIGGVGGNGAGVAGTCWSVTLVSAKFIGSNGGSVSAAVKAMDYITDLKTRHGLDVVATNNSWAGSGYSQALHNAVLRAAKQGILTIAAAGNSMANNDAVAIYPANLSTLQGTSTESPASYEAVIAVAAIDRYGALASFSNYGPTKVDLGAPGVAIVSTVPPTGYASWSGTSMATPHVTGAAALYKAANPGALASQVRDAILSSVTPTPSLAGKVATGGRLNVGGWLSGQAAIHDVAVESIGAPVSLAKGASATITVLVRNQGTVVDTTTVSMTDTPPAGGAAGSLTAPQSVTLAAGAASTLSFTWNTAPATIGTHVLRATASTVAGEIDVADNTRTVSSTVTTPSADPMAVYSINPSSISRDSYLSVTVTGQGFLPGAHLTFTNGAGDPPTAYAVVVAADGHSLTATVIPPDSLLSLTLPWDVVVTNPDGHSASLSAAFHVVP